MVITPLGNFVKRNGETLIKSYHPLARGNVRKLKGPSLSSGQGFLPSETVS
jgi:hypothetical protein